MMKKRICSLGLVFAMLVTHVFALGQFTDVSSDNPYYEAIEYVYNNQLMEGCSAERFEPDIYVNRAMVVMVLWRMDNCISAFHVTSFTDVGFYDWYCEAVTWAQDDYIVNGYGEWGTPDYVFKPLDLATKEQLWTMLWRYTEMNKLTELAEDVNLSMIADIDRVSEYAMDAVKWGYANG
ncbi:MAG: S-layer homology domain-containing protein [Clostridia bacterium]|nr:S-layer homology domain-containing protein [Clostridia bacterium]